MDLDLLWRPLEEKLVLAQLHPGKRLIVMNEEHVEEFKRNEGFRRFTVAHELGHWFLHAEPARSGTMELLAEQQVWCRHPTRRPPEVQADLFAGYLLAPTDLLRTRLPQKEWSGWGPVYRMAHFFGLSATAMIVRLEQAHFAYRDDAKVPQSGRRPGSELPLFS